MISGGINVWMITGDKLETAAQIGLSCGMYSSHDRLISINEKQKNDESWVE